MVVFHEILGVEKPKIIGVGSIALVVARRMRLHTLKFKSVSTTFGNATPTEKHENTGRFTKQLPSADYKSVKA